MDESEKSKITWEMVMSNFTDDLWMEIFLRLPLKSLLRFKSVSKSWFSIICSHRFAESHLETAPKDDEILIIFHELFDGVHLETSYSLFHLDSWRVLNNLKFPFSQGEYPSFVPIFCKLIGSDCGIVCVSVNLLEWRAAKKKHDIYLWNPATKHSKLIPPYTIPDIDCTSGILGFGFDRIDLDFKLVRVVSHTLSAEVYSSNRNSWRKIESKPIHTLSSSSFHVFHGFLFAMGQINNNTMMAFNFNKEVFICDINLPVSSLDDAHSHIQTCITDFVDTIAVIIFVLNKGNINLWTLDDEACICSGVKASWKKVLSIDVGVPLIFVKGFLNNDQLLLIGKMEDMCLYNWKRNVTTEVPTDPYVEIGQSFKYTESLFSLVGFKRIKWDA